jgi:hypothetical protein
LLAPPWPRTGLLGGGRGELEDLDPRPGGGGEHDAARLADAEGRLGVLRVERALEREDAGPQRREQLLEVALDLREPQRDRRARVRLQHAAREEARTVRRDDERSVAHRTRAGIDAEHDRPGAAFGHERGGDHAAEGTDSSARFHYPDRAWSTRTRSPSWSRPGARRAWARRCGSPS